MRFQLKIQLGNDAMQEPEDVARALERVAEQLREVGWRGAPVRDMNGNRVGEWSVSGVRPPRRRHRS